MAETHRALVNAPYCDCVVVAGGASDPCPEGNHVVSNGKRYGAAAASAMVF